MQLYTRDIIIHYTSARNTIYIYVHNICTHLFLLVVLISVQIKAISCEWEQSSTPIVLAGQVMSLLSVPEQRSSSSHVRVVDKGWEKLYIGGNKNYCKSCIYYIN